MTAVSLFFLLRGDEPEFRRIFRIEVEPTEVITDIREKIVAKKEKLQGKIEPDELALYKLKKPIPTSSNEIFNQEIARIDLDTEEGLALVEELNPTATVQQSGLSTPEMLHLHIIVVAPTVSEVVSTKGAPNESFDYRAFKLVAGLYSLHAKVLQLVVNTIFMIPETSSLGTERGNNQEFKLQLYKFYYEPDASGYPDKLTCSLTGVTLSSNAIIAAHLWRHATGLTKDWFGFKDINDPRNGLLLYKPIEEAYDRHLLCFIKDDKANLRCRVLSRSLQNMTFNEFFAKNHLKRASKPAGIEPTEVQKAVPYLKLLGFSTFKDLEGENVYLRFPQTREPFKRVLNLHAIRAHKLASEKGDIPLAEFEDFYSEGSYGGRAAIEAWRNGLLGSLGEGSIHISESE